MSSQIFFPATGSSSSVLPGTVTAFAGSVAPAGWLFAYGQAISRTTYAALFSAIGTTYGNGDGSITFNLPDLRGRVIAGKDDMGGASAGRLVDHLNGSVLGQAGGQEGVTLSENEMPNHTHAAQLSSGNAISDAGGGGSYSIQNDGGGGNTGNTGGGAPHTNVQPTIVSNYIIKT